MEYDPDKAEGQPEKINIDPHQCRLGITCRLMRRPEVLALISIARSTLNEWVRLGLFPTQVQMGRRAVGWRSCEVYDWRATRPPVRPLPTTPRGRVHA